MDELPYTRMLLTALPLLAFIVNLSFGIFIWRRKKLLVNRVFALLMFAFCWWNMGEFVMRLVASKGSAGVILSFINIAIPCIPPIALAFVMALENKTPSRRQFAAMVLGPLLFIILNLAGMLANNVKVRFDVYMIAPMNLSISNGYVYFIVYMTVFTTYVIYRLIRFYRLCENEMVKKRIQYMLAGVFVTTIITFLTEFIVPVVLLPMGIDIPSLGSSSTIFLTSLTYYSVRSR
ncbi:MAG: hypothetical protein NTY73_04255 [Candidatus Micrarchaeota archaeon]|nr:hypothetical protein [Candidatus Micrarchaeota archaeon]